MLIGVCQHMGKDHSNPDHHQKHHPEEVDDLKQQRLQCVKGNKTRITFHNENDQRGDPSRPPFGARGREPPSFVHLESAV